MWLFFEASRLAQKELRWDDDEAVRKAWGMGAMGWSLHGQKTEVKARESLSANELEAIGSEITNKKHPHFLIEIWKSWKC